MTNVNNLLIAEYIYNKFHNNNNVFTDIPGHVDYTSMVYNKSLLGESIKEFLNLKNINDEIQVLNFLELNHNAIIDGFEDHFNAQNKNHILIGAEAFIPSSNNPVNKNSKYLLAY